jgi:ribosome-binding factor A
MPRDFPRSRRIEEQIQRILSDVLRTNVRDPRLANVILTGVRVTKDLSVAWVYYTVLQVEGEVEPLDDAFASAMGFLRSRLAKDLTVRRVPELRFELDETSSRAREMDQLISDATNMPGNPEEVDQIDSSDEQE